MFGRKNLYWKIGIILLVMVITVPLWAACGSSNKSKTTTPAITTTTSQATAAPTTSAPTTPASTTANTSPVKIGILVPWSGSLAMTGSYVVDPEIQFADYLIKQQGGILGGRPVEFVKGDSQSTTAGAQAAFTKLALQDKVSAVIYGGATIPEGTTSIDMADQLKVPVFVWGSEPEDLTNYPYAIRPDLAYSMHFKIIAQKLVLDQLKPKTVGYLMDDDTANRDYVGLMKNILDPAGIQTVSEQYVSPGTSDYTPYLTKIKHDNPDVLLIHSANIATYINIYTAIKALGGWGNIKVVCLSAAADQPQIQQMSTAVGSYISTIWSDTLTDPGSLQFIKEWTAFPGSGGRTPENSVRAHYVLWTAIEAIEQGGSANPQDIATYARSGNLKWDAPGGELIIGPDGNADPTTGFGNYLYQITAPGKIAIVPLD